jgi:hypothetical protein
MTAIPFATRVICYCLGTKGQLDLRGKRSRPWLKLRRSELEQTYLDHQVRMLRRLHPQPGSFKVHWNRLSADSVYDDLVAEFTCPELWGAYDLLYPRDRRRITSEALVAAGLPGLAAAWLDEGERNPQSAKLRLFGPGPSDVEILGWIESLGTPGRIAPGPRLQMSLAFDQWQADTLVRQIRPLVHRSMAYRLRPAAPGARALYAGL